MRRSVVSLCRVALAAASIVFVGCGPETPPGPVSPIVGNLPAGGQIYQSIYYSPTICAPVGTEVRVDISGNEHGAGAKLMDPEAIDISGMSYVAIGGGAMTMTSTIPCWQVFITHADFAGLDGDDLDFVITWPV